MDTVAVDVGTATVNLVKWNWHSLHVEKLPTADPASALRVWLELLGPSKGFTFRYTTTQSRFAGVDYCECLFEIARVAGATKTTSSPSGMGNGCSALEWVSNRHRMTGQLGIDGGAHTIHGHWSSTLGNRHGFFDLPKPASDDTAARLKRLVETIQAHRARFQKGTELRLVCFGGWGPLVAAALAEKMESQHVVVPDYAGCFDALGLILQGDHYVAQRMLNDRPFSMDVFRSVCRELMEEIARQISLDGLDFDDVTCSQWVKVGRRGWNDNQFLHCNSRMSEHDIVLGITGNSDDELGDNHDLVMREAVSSARFDVTGIELPPPPLATTRQTSAMPDDEIRHHLRTGDIVERRDLASGAQVDGPTAIREPWHVTVVPQGWNAEAAMAGGIVLRRLGA